MTATPECITEADTSTQLREALDTDATPRTWSPLKPLSAYTTHGRCKCDKCERQWKRGEP